LKLDIKTFAEIHRYKASKHRVTTRGTMPKHVLNAEIKRGHF
jgi:hypothetical protein